MVCLSKGPVIEGEKRHCQPAQGDLPVRGECLRDSALQLHTGSIFRELCQEEQRQTQNGHQLEIGLLYLQQNIDIPEISFCGSPHCGHGDHPVL